MKDLIQCSFQATKESCILTSLGYVFQYIANTRGIAIPKFEDVFWTYIEYFRHSHPENGLSGKKLIDWAKGKSFSKQHFPIESKKIRDNYRHNYPGYINCINDSDAELLSTIMLHWVCSEENKDLNQKSGKRGYEEVIDFWNYCKTQDKYKDLLASTDTFAHKANKDINYNSEVEAYFTNENMVGLILYPMSREKHSICIYQQEKNFIKRDPNDKQVNFIDLGALNITEYIIFEVHGENINYPS